MNEKRHDPALCIFLSLGESKVSEEWLDYLQYGIGSRHVPALIEMATDMDLNLAPSGSDEVWASLHAWRALGQLQASEAVEPLLRLLAEDPDDDWLHSELPEVMAKIGPAAIAPLAKVLGDRSLRWYPRAACGTALEKIGSATPERRDECVAALTRQLERYEESGPELIGCLLIRLRAVESADAMRRAFAADAVDITIPGDWYDVAAKLGLEVDDSEQFPRLTQDMLFAPFQKAAGKSIAVETTGGPGQAQAKKRKRRRRKKRKR